MWGPGGGGGLEGNERAGFPGTKNTPKLLEDHPNPEGGVYNSKRGFSRVGTVRLKCNQ